MVDVLAKGLDIRYGHAVHRIEYHHSDGVVIHTANDQVFHGSEAIITVPLGTHDEFYCN